VETVAGARATVLDFWRWALSDLRDEVKSAAYLQAWPTDRHSRIVDVDQWRFWVAPRAAVAARGSRSLSMEVVGRIAAGPLGFGELEDAVAAAASG
jgi:hypothetical protein